MQSELLPHEQKTLLPTTCPANATVVNGAEFVCLSSGEGENQIGSISMQTAARKSLALIDFFSLNRVAEIKPAINHAEFYQYIVSELTKGICTRQVFTDLGNRLIDLAEYAYDLRRMDIVEQASAL